MFLTVILKESGSESIKARGKDQESAIKVRRQNRSNRESWHQTDFQREHTCQVIVYRHAKEKFLTRLELSNQIEKAPLPI